MSESLKPLHTNDKAIVGTPPSHEKMGQLATNRVVENISPVCIGMPVYNGEKFIRAALDSLLAQTFTDFKLIISDNASTDGTSKICKEYARADNRISFVRQHENIGATKNFAFVLNESSEKYFMWAAADDFWSEDFLECNISFLEKNTDYVASISPVRFEDGNFDPVFMGDAGLTGDTPERFEKFFKGWHANSRFYSLMRTSTLKHCPYLLQDYLGADWVTMLYIVRQGKTNRHALGFVIRGHSGFSNSGKILKYYRRRWINWLLPFIELSKDSLEMSIGFPVQYKINIYIALAKMNILAVLVSTKCSIRNALVR